MPFVAINSITCRPEYVGRFEELFGSRAGEIDQMPGFLRMAVLRPQKSGEPYLVMSEWESEEAFQSWMRSPAFAAGHRRGFDDLAKAKEAGQPAPMTSTFRTYEVMAK